MRFPRFKINPKKMGFESWRRRHRESWLERKGGEHGAKRVKGQGLHKVEEEFSKQIQALC